MEAMQNANSHGGAELSTFPNLSFSVSPGRLAMTLAYMQLSRIRLVWDFLCQGCITPFLSCFVASFFVRPAPRAFFRPDRILPSPSRTVTVKDGACSAPPKACPSPTRARRQAARDRVGYHAMIRGEPAIGHEQSRANHACIRL